MAALAFTSANGVRAFADISAERGLKVFAVGAATAQAAPYCGITWGSTAKTHSAHDREMVNGIRAGRHASFDRMVVALGGYHNMSLEQFLRIYKEHPGDYGICFEYR